MPVFQFDPQDAPSERVNYWGYAPVSFFAPHQAYSSRQDPLEPLDEFRDMCRRSPGLIIWRAVAAEHIARSGF